MKEGQLLTAEVLKALPPLYSNEQKELGDVVLVAKFFYPDFSWTWFASEYNPEDRIFFGYVSGFENEWGYFGLDELLEGRGKLGLEIERDLHFKPIPFKELKS